MNRLLCIMMLSFTLLSTTATAGQSPAANYDPAAKSRVQQTNPFGSFSNPFQPKKIDYGQCIEDGRRILIESTIYELLFWVNVVSLGALISFFFYIMRLRGERKQMISSTAKVVTEYQNQLSTGHANYHRLHEEYRKYLDELDREKEPKLAQKMPQLKSKNAGDQRESGSESKSAPVAVIAAQPDQTQAANQSAGNDTIFRSLQQQITVLTQQLEQERQKNRKLRGE